ncbi:cation:dicarboxylate symporter family transporter [Mycobacterium sp. Aquia_213]|uniref:cation:dicarboxylate symporter family transporter n=1 Tax=Mycobacterium sp. Aquia_213 TaxID=2991728 RepID=UPI00226D6FAE|nr:cation:dicarboxylase symporter family transporter [Mycobacterium sp. Aquia_213]WAC93189.1 cation:dicarboxylase symporter family transporter [Mycobacterium sp. Aquia_213]
MPTANKRIDRTRWLYFAVAAAVVAGVIVGLAAPGIGKSVGVLGTMFLSLMKMMIAPIVFCTIVLGIGAMSKAQNVGKVGALAVGCFLVISSVALGLGLAVGNLLGLGSGLYRPGADLELSTPPVEHVEHTDGFTDLIHHIVPTSLLTALTVGNVLQSVFVALLVGFAIRSMGAAGEPILVGIGHLQKLVFQVLGIVLWLAPLGAFGAIADVVGSTGWSAITNLLMMVGAFYLTCAVFVFGVLGVLLRVVSGVSIFRLVRYLAREYLLIVATSSSEPALPRLIAKMEHLGVERGTVGVVVPIGYSFNLDGTAIYLTMATLFIADALGHPLGLRDQFWLLLYMMVASKGAAGISGAGLATLAEGLHRLDLLGGTGLLVGVDRFMSEGRAITNFSGNAVATVLVGTWSKTIDRAKVDAVLHDRDPFDELTMIDEPDEEPPAARQRTAA